MAAGEEEEEDKAKAEEGKDGEEELKVATRGRSGAEETTFRRVTAEVDRRGFMPPTFSLTVRRELFFLRGIAMIREAEPRRVDGKNVLSYLD